MMSPQRAQVEADKARAFISAVLAYDEERRKLALMLDDLRSSSNSVRDDSGPGLGDRYEEE
jgi:hypothetical protein